MGAHPRATQALETRGSYPWAATGSRRVGGGQAPGTGIGARSLPGGPSARGRFPANMPGTRNRHPPCPLSVLTQKGFATRAALREGVRDQGRWDAVCPSSLLCGSVRGYGGVAPGGWSPAGGPAKSRVHTSCPGHGAGTPGHGHPQRSSVSEKDSFYQPRSRVPAATPLPCSCPPRALSRHLLPLPGLSRETQAEGTTQFSHTRGPPGARPRASGGLRPSSVPPLRAASPRVRGAGAPRHRRPASLERAFGRVLPCLGLRAPPQHL